MDRQKYKDYFYTIDEPSIAEYKEKGSKFIAYAIPIENTIQTEEWIEKIRKEHFKARHWCYAYSLGDEFRVNDDGEPSGTAGKPIFGQIKSFKLDRVLIVVVRYFGGVKLGTSGLITAYKTAAKEALTSAKIIKKLEVSLFYVVFDYSHEGKVLNELKKLFAVILKKDYSEKITLTVGVPKSEAASFKNKFTAALIGYEPENVDENTQLEYCQITYSGHTSAITELENCHHK